MALDIARGTAAVRARLAQFSGPQKTIVALLAVVGLVLTGSFYRWVSAPSYEVLLSGLAPTDAAAVTAQLGTDGVDYQLANGGSTVLVPSASVQAERLAVAAAGLPEGTTKGYELLDKGSMTSSSFQQKVAYQRAVEGELAKTLQQMQAVQAATVHLSVPEKELYTDKAAPTRASVLLTTRGTLASDSVDSVQRLVAAAVPDLQPQDVTVSDTKGALLSSDGGSGSAAEAQQTLQDAAVARAESMLTSLLGPGHAVVRVTAELDPTARTSESDTYDPTKTVTLRKDLAKETYTGANPGAAAGPVQLSDPAATASASPSPGVYDKSGTKEEYGVTHRVDKTTTDPGAVRRLTVAVALDNRSVTLAQQEVSDLVSGAVGLDPARGDTIAVTSTAFVGAPETAAAPAGGALDLNRIITLAVAGLVLLLIALTLLRAARRASVAEIPLSDLALVPADETATPAIAPPPARALEPGRSEADQDQRILELVDSRPDDVSSLIRSWLAEPAEPGAVSGAVSEPAGR